MVGWSDGRRFHSTALVSALANDHEKKSTPTDFSHTNKVTVMGQTSCLLLYPGPQRDYSGKECLLSWFHQRRVS